MASSSIVIKVKFGETLRRFSVFIREQKLVLDIITLRAKIGSLFDFDSDVDFTLTYIDEDGDVVTLADDDDLHDVVRQSLNPLRITVNLNNSQLGGSSGSSTPLRSLQDQLPFQTINSGVSEILKSVPEPLHDALSKVSADLASKATSSAPGLAELVEKLKMIYLNQLSDSIAGSRAQTPTGGASNINGQYSTDSESSTVKDMKVIVDPEVRRSISKNKEEQLQKVTEGVKFKDVQPSRPVDLNVPYFEYDAFQGPVNITKGVGGSDGRSYSQVVSDNPAEKNIDATDAAEKKKDSGVEKVSDFERKDTGGGSSTGVQCSAGFGASNLHYLRHFLQDPNTSGVGGSTSADFTKATKDSDNSSGWVQGMLSATTQCPFGGIPLPSDSNLHSYHYPSRNPHCKRSYNHGNGIGSIFHRGVRCDGCGVHPITGPRFKSKVKENYDLCSVCFAGMGNVADYIRLDRPVNPRHPMPFKGYHDPSLRIPPPLLPHALRAPGTKLPRSKLDSRFILDVNVLDGTIMAPFTTFTKIWRMRNNGTIIWPHGSQLQWIGGDRLSNSISVEVEIPADGLPVDKELDVAVDFTAPELPGRYISYWRMTSPSGQKFGQRVWVLIQVDASMRDLGETSINLNLPPVAKYPELVNQDPPLMDSILPANNFIGVTDSGNSFVDAQPKDQEMNFPINDTLIIGNEGVSSTMATLSPPVGAAAGSSIFYPTVGVDAASPEPIVYPTVDFSEVLPTIVSTAPAPTVPVAQPSASTTREVDDDQEQALLRELEEMGFKQPDLNKEILRMNGYDLEKSVDDLCGVSEWDPMLDELQEMGFSDNEANRRLLKKNGGSIKRVVMDLINGEKA